MASTVSHTVKVILLSGRSGSGKSRTAYEVAHTLLQQGVMHANIEGDNLDTMYPCSDSNPSTMLMNLRAIWGNYWDRACVAWNGSCTFADCETPFVTLINGTGVVMQVEYIEAMIQEIVLASCEVINLSGVKVEVCPVILEAGEATVAQRLTEREIGGELEQHLISTRNMDGVLQEWSQKQNRLINSVVSEGRNVHQVPIEILQLAGITPKG